MPATHFTYPFLGAERGRSRAGARRDPPMTFQSVHHPGTASRPWLAVQAQARPVALALLVVMTVGLAAALQGRNILWPFVGGAAVAYSIAAMVGQNRLVTTPAQVDVRGPFAAVQSVWEAAATVPEGRLDAGVVGPPPTRRADGRPGRHGRRRSDPEDWPDFDGLVEAFRGAAQRGPRVARPSVMNPSSRPQLPELALPFPEAEGPGAESVLTDTDYE